MHQFSEVKYRPKRSRTGHPKNTTLAWGSFELKTIEKKQKFAVLCLPPTNLTARPAWLLYAHPLCPDHEEQKLVSEDNSIPLSVQRWEEFHNKPCKTSSNLPLVSLKYLPSHNLPPPEAQSPFPLPCHFFTKLLLLTKKLCKRKL